MRIRFVGAALLALGLAAPALAQDFGVMESAETLNRGNIKLMAYPLLIFGSQDEDNQLGVVGRAGYGFTDNLDAENEGRDFRQANDLRGRPRAVAAEGRQPGRLGDRRRPHPQRQRHRSGYQGAGSDGPGQHAPQRQPGAVWRVRRCLREEISDVPSGFDDTFTTVHVVPGIGPA